MNKKAQASFVLTALIIVVVMGVVLYTFSPAINDIRTDALQELNTNNPTGQPLEKIILTALMPLLWLIYIIFGGIALVVSVRQSQGIL